MGILLWHSAGHSGLDSSVSCDLAVYIQKHTFQCYKPHSETSPFHSEISSSVLNWISVTSISNCKDFTYYWLMCYTKMGFTKEHQEILTLLIYVLSGRNICFFRLLCFVYEDNLHSTIKPTTISDLTVRCILSLLGKIWRDAIV